MTIREQEVLGQVRAALAHEPTLESPKITITMMGDDAVSLAGILDTDEQVLRAGVVAQSAVPGVTIDNGLTVAQSPHGKQAP